MSSLRPSTDGEEPIARRASKKLRKKQYGDLQTRFDLPETLRQEDEDTTDASQPQTEGPPMFVNMNQSIFGIITAAGSKVDFHERFDGSSSEDEDGEPTQQEDDEEDMSKTTTLTRPSGTKVSADHKRRLSGHRLLSSVPNLPSKLKHLAKHRRSKLSRAETERPNDDNGDDDHDDDERRDSKELRASVSEPPAIRLHREDSKLAPFMSGMLEARAEVSGRPSFDMGRISTDVGRTGDDDVTPLARRLMQIFEFDAPEEVVQEYPCWLLQSVLLQGFMYITAKHICFYAYLPKKAHEVAKSGYLSKTGKHNPKFNRYWFRLKGDVLSYYRDSTNLYFPHGHIDLSYGISASITDKEKDSTHFEVVTSHRTYTFKADSAPSAKEWVKSLQRVIFRSHNEGDSVKISLPIENVIDVEDTQMMEFADTCKIRVIDNDETYAIDEYFFSFFTFGKEAINVLKILVEDFSGGARASHDILSPSRPSHQTSRSVSHSSMQPGSPRNPKLPEPVKATLNPVSPPSTAVSPRVSHDATRSSFDALRQLGRSRKSIDLSGLSDDRPRRSFSGNRLPSASRRSTSLSRPDNTASGQQPEYSVTDSYVQDRSSVEDPSFSNLAPSTNDDPSASQILKSSEVFTNPALLGSGHMSSQPRSSSDNGAAERPIVRDGNREGEPAAPTLQNISKMGSYPLQRVGAFADYLNKTRRNLTSLVATESMGYAEKVSGMWKGGRKHYDEPTGPRPDEDDLYEDSDGKIQTSMERFRAHFALPDHERLVATYFGHIHRGIPIYGKIYISDRNFCFRSLLPGTRTKLILPLRDIENATKEKGFRFGYSGLVVVIKGHEELFFEFRGADIRDDCAVTLLQSLETAKFLQESGILDEHQHELEESAIAERDALKEVRQEEFPSHELKLPRRASGLANAPPILLDEDMEGSMLNFKPQQSLNITCLTIGSRGDVQPYIALCKGLLAEGHKPRIATHAEFGDWIKSHGIEFARVEGDPGELMRLCIENGTFTWAFLREANSTFRGWLDELLDSAYQACEGSDILIESPSAMAGIHIAEKLGIPYFRAFTMPWTRTRAYPHAFIMPQNKMGGTYNYMTYVMFDNVFWRATAHQVNRWRNKTLGLPSTSLEKMQPYKVPFLYNFSPSVVAPPLDFSDWIRVTGYWFLDEENTYEPPKELADFIKKAREDGKKLVYVGFGSIIVNNPAKMTQEVIDAVLKADVRCILSKGWSERPRVTESTATTSEPPPPEPEMPPEIHVISSAPHDWLFKQIDAAAHHGGSGTTGASLRAGIPTIIRPFFGDQFFFASRVEDLGCGVWVKKWGTNAFGRALWQATREERMIAKAKLLGEEIRKENGVDTAIKCIYRDLEYAKSIIKRRGEEDNAEEEEEESWAFIGRDEPDPDAMTQKLSAGLGGPAPALGSQVLKGAG